MRIENHDNAKSKLILVILVIAFAISFATWMLNGVLVTYLVDNGIRRWDNAQIGWVIGAPVLTGAIMRLPVGILTDRFGGRLIFSLVMLISAVPLYLLSYTDSYASFLIASLGFGLIGSTFAVGVAYIPLWFPKERHGAALGVFGIGTAGGALTSLFAPMVLNRLASGQSHFEGWRNLPRLYALMLAITAILFFILTTTRVATQDKRQSLISRLKPLKDIRVWRFGFYYFFLFGGFVGISQWLIPYYVNVYGKSVAIAGFFAALFSLPAGVLRAIGGWSADKWGARTVMYFVLSLSIILLIFLLPPRMELEAPGQGILAERAGIVTSVSDKEILVGSDKYILNQSDEKDGVKVHLGIHTQGTEEEIFAWPVTSFRQEAIVKVGDHISKKQLLARGLTHIYFQANVVIFTIIILTLGMAMGLGSGGVFKYIPSYFPENVGIVGGLVGVLGGLGGFACPIIFGYLLKLTGIWTTCWLFLLAVALISLVWMYFVVRKIESEKRKGAGWPQTE